MTNIHRYVQDYRVSMADYSRALDEIYRLRAAAAHEATVARVHGVFKTFPKSRRKALDEQIARLEAVARGEAATQYTDVTTHSMKISLAMAGAKTELTRSQFEDEHHAQIQEKL